MSRSIGAALAVVVLSACGANSRALSSILPVGASGPSPAAAAVTVHLGDDPRLAPVERLFSASNEHFKAAQFLSAFDATAQPCDIRRIAQRLDGRAATPPVDVSSVRLVSVRSLGDTGAVEVTDEHPFYVRLRQVGGQWIVDENACMWVGEVDGGQLSAATTTGLAELTAGDPRRVPAAALIDSLSGPFDAARFVSAFDLTDQPCAVATIARNLAAQPAIGGPIPQTRFFLRPMTDHRAGVLASADGEALPIRIRLVDGRWLLDENACLWLTLSIGAKVAAEDRGVQSDLRNALTAEKTTYTDTQTYSASPALMKTIEPSLAWGTRLQVHVADAQTPGDRNVVCLTEVSGTGTPFSIADIAMGPRAGTYFGTRSCPVPLTADAVARLGTSWPGG